MIATTRTTVMDAASNNVVSVSDAVEVGVIVGSIAEFDVTVGVHVGDVEFDSPTKNLIGEVVILK